jgi:hypothetical protein
MVVFTGLSGSGKSSLAFDTIFAEGQRRYVESLSSYARQFLRQMQKIIPHLWFDTQAVEAAGFYTSAFGNGSKITSKQQLKNTPSGDCDIVGFDLCGYSFMAISVCR